MGTIIPQPGGLDFLSRSRPLIASDLVENAPFPPDTHLAVKVLYASNKSAKVDPDDTQANVPRIRIGVKLDLSLVPASSDTAIKPSLAVISLYAHPSWTRDQAESEFLKLSKPLAAFIAARAAYIQADGGLYEGVKDGKMQIRLVGQRAIQKDQQAPIVLSLGNDPIIAPAKNLPALHSKLADTAILQPDRRKPVSTFAPKISAGMARTTSAEGSSRGKRGLSPSVVSAPIIKRTRTEIQPAKTIHQLAPTGTTSQAQMTTAPERSTFLPSSLDAEADADSDANAEVIGSEVPPSPEKPRPHSGRKSIQAELEEARRKQEELEEERKIAEEEELQIELERIREENRRKEEEIQEIKRRKERRQTTGSVLPDHDVKPRITARASLPSNETPRRVFTPRAETSVLEEQTTPTMSSRQVAEEAARRQRAAELARTAAAQQSTDRAMGRLQSPLEVVDGNRTVRYELLKQVGMGHGRNFIGVVQDVQPVRKAGMGDHHVTLAITDPSLYDDKSPNATEDMLVTIFRPSPNELPADIPLGTAILFRGVMVKLYKDKPKGQLYSSDRTGGFVHLDAQGGICKLAGNAAIHVGPAEEERMRGLAKWWAAVPGRSAGVVTGGASPVRQTGKKSTLIGQTIPGSYMNGVFKILYIHQTNRGNLALEVYVTDGTTHPSSVPPPRNFHSIAHDAIPSRAIFCLGIFDPPTPDERGYYTVGKYIKMSNIRVKTYRDQVELEWNPLHNQEQDAAGWQRRRISEVARTDPEAREVERRLSDMSRGGESIVGGVGTSGSGGGHWSEARQESPTRPAHSSRPTPTAQATVPMSNRISTVHLDEIDHVRTPLSQVESNTTVPNRFVVHARVKSLHAKSKGGSLVVKYCTHCKRTFTDPYCQSCNDHRLVRAEWRYRFLAKLEDAELSSISNRTLAVLVSDQAAADFLPPLPPIKDTSGRPNDEAAVRRQIARCNNEAEEIMMGNKLDGERERPVVRWSIESYRPGNLASQGDKGGKGKGKMVVAYRVFGMRRV